MKTTKLQKVKSILFGIGLLSSLGLSAQGTASLQAIHNSPHPTAEKVDIWVSYTGVETKRLTDFGFREATGFVTVPAGIPLTVSVALPGSTSISDTVAGLSITATLTDGERYILLAQGNVATTGYAPNPGGIDTRFSFVPVGGIRAQSNNPANVDFLVVHGSPDAPAVDIYAQGIGTPLIPNLAFNQASSYIEVPADKYFINVNVAGTQLTAFVRTADLTSLAGNAVTVFASGYLAPANNQNGPAFGLFAALENGTVVELPTPSARAQVVHNAADPAAAEVDIYVNGQKAIPNFAFRSATPYIDLPAQQSLSIGVAPANSANASEIIADFFFELEDEAAYIVVANGVLAPAAFAANPSSKSIGFDLYPILNAREEADDETKVDIIVFHGATDAPAVDVATAGTNLIENLAYGESQGYLSVDPADYILDIIPSNTSDVLVKYDAPLAALAGESVTVIASGFLSPGDNQDGAPFGLIAVLADGTVLPLTLNTASVKSISTVQGNVYPNPSNTFFQVEVADMISANYEITSVSGQVVANGSWLNGQKINTNDLPLGLYYFKLFSDNKVLYAPIQVVR